MNKRKNFHLRNYLIKGKKISFPIYCPDATRAVVRGLDTRDLEAAKVEALVVNTYHLMTQPGKSVFKKLGGIKSYMNWSGLIISDSGGFQVLSMIYRNKSFGKINDEGVIFYHSSGGKKKKYRFTPEKSIEVQFNLGADILICLDDCPAARAAKEKIEVSVRRTIEWAARCKEKFLSEIEAKKMKEDERPLLFAVIQGGDDKNLRKKCAEGLKKIGFDGFCFGGWPINKEGNFNLDILKYTLELMPWDLPKFALGVGTPQDIVDCFKLGYNIFDCVLPTRDARHQRLYIFSQNPEKADILKKNIHEHLYILREKYVRDNSPISEFCDCHTCRNYSRAYLHHLFRIEDSLAGRLATIHNLRTYTKLIEVLRKKIDKIG